MFHSVPFSKAISLHSSCPSCGQSVSCPAPTDITRLVELTEREEILWLELCEAAGKPENKNTAQRCDLLAAMYQDEEYEPSQSRMYSDFQVALDGLRSKVGPFGVSFLFPTRREVRIALDPIPASQIPDAVVAGKSGNLECRVRNRFPSVSCFCCGQTVVDPSLEMFMQAKNLQPRERQVLRAIQQHRGMPASNEWLFTVMFGSEDAIERPKMYNALKTALSKMRGKLKNSGITIRNLGYAVGYVIVH